MSLTKQTNKQDGLQASYKLQAPHVTQLSASSSLVQLPFPSLMPAKRWATEEQLEFLTTKDSEWSTVKTGSSSLKGFYSRTTKTFLEKWPVTPDAETLEKAEGDPEKAKQLAEANLLKVSTLLAYLAFLSSRFAAYLKLVRQPPPYQEISSISLRNGPRSFWKALTQEASVTAVARFLSCLLQRRELSSP